MPKFFKKEEKRPFSYGTIVEHRENSNTAKWIIGVVILIILLLISYFIFK